MPTFELAPRLRATQEEFFIMKTRLEARPGSGAGITPLQRGRLGIALPATMEPRQLAAMARLAEELGYHSIWLEHERDERADALSTIAYLAGRTSRIALASRLDLPAGCAHWHLIERLDAVNSLTGGRLVVGMEHPVNLSDGSFASSAPAQVAGLVRVPTERTDLAGATILAACDITYQPVDGERPAFVGTFEQVAVDVDRYRRLGAYEVILDLRHSASVASPADYAWHLERLREAVEPGLAVQRSLAGTADAFDYIT